jgi:antitoxin component of MazEF toxin-antitoxin module
MSNKTIDLGIRLEDSTVYATGVKSVAVVIPAMIRNTVGVEVGDTVERYWNGSEMTIRFKAKKARKE